MKIKMRGRSVTLVFKMLTHFFFLHLDHHLLLLLFLIPCCPPLLLLLSSPQTFHRLIQHLWLSGTNACSGKLKGISSYPETNRSTAAPLICDLTGKIPATFDFTLKCIPPVLWWPRAALNFLLKPNAVWSLRQISPQGLQSNLVDLPSQRKERSEYCLCAA